MWIQPAGDHKQGGAKSRVKSSCSPYFGQCFEFALTLPGTSRLTLSVWDWDRVGSNDLIGATTFDLEDRFFSRVWRDLGARQDNGASKKANKDGGPAAASSTSMVFVKPIETRMLTLPGTKQYRGEVDFAYAIHVLFSSSIFSTI